MAGAQARILNANINNEEALKKIAGQCLPELYRQQIFTPEEVKEEDILPIAKAYAQMQIRMHKIVEAMANGDYSQENEIISTAYVNMAQPEKPPALSPKSEYEKWLETKQKMPLSQAIGEYIKQRMDDGAWKERSLPDHRQRLTTLLEILGDKPLNAVTREDMRVFRDKLRKLPPRYSKSKEYRGKSIDAILAMKPEQTLNVKTVNTIVTTVVTMLGWYEKENILANNPGK